jgi:hypothetical protein
MNPVYQLLYAHTADGSLVWSRGSHSDIWDGKHANYKVFVGGAVRTILTVRVNATGDETTLYLWPQEWRALLAMRPRTAEKDWGWFRT